MSLLGTQVFANSDVPIWVGTSGGTITGNLDVEGTLGVTGNVDLTGPQVSVEGQLSLQGPNAKISFLEVGVGSGLQLQSDAIQTNGFIETDGTLYLGRFLAGTTANTTFIPSAPTTNGDVLTVGGQILTAPGGGICPLVSSTGSTNVPIGVSTSLAPTPAIPITSGLTYDVQINGYVSIPAGTTPAATDKLEIITSVGPGTSPAFYARSVVTDFYPAFTEDPWVAGTNRPFTIRGRLPCTSTQANITINATLTGPGTFPSGVDIVLSQVSVVRVA